MSRSTHPRYDAATLYERGMARRGRRYVRSSALVRRAIAESAR